MKKNTTAGELRAMLAHLPNDAPISVALYRVLPARYHFANAALRFVAAFASGVMFADGIFNYAVGESAIVSLLLSGASAIIAWLWPGDRR